MNCAKPVMGIYSRFTFCSYAQQGRARLRSLIEARTPGKNQIHYLAAALNLAPGQTYYQSTQAVVTRVLAGDARGPITFSVKVQALPPNIAEETPIVGQEYILFLARHGVGYDALKVLTPTPENLDAVNRARPNPHQD